MARHRARELVLQSAISRSTDVGHARVGKEVKACLLGGVHHGGAIDTLKAIYHQYLTLGLGCDVGGKHLGGEALSTAVDGRDLETIHMSSLKCDVATGGIDALSIIPSAVVDTGIEYITFGYGRGFSLVGGGAPREAHLVATHKVYGKGVHGEGLHGVLGAVHRGRIVQYTFIYSARGDELEVRVVSIAHVGKVLVREELDDARGHIGQARLAIVLVPHGTANEAIDVVLYIGLHHVGEVARGVA